MRDLSRLNRPSAWDLGNEILYDLCAEYPDHSEPEVVVAKLWLIGRAHSAPLEGGRPRKTAATAEAFYTGRAVPILLDSPVDEWLAELDGASLGWTDLPRVLLAHGHLTALFKSISGRAQRALASKYLHFHRPALFFLFDARAEEAARQECPDPRSVDTGPELVDNEYALFARRCLELTESLASRAPVALTPRAIDRYLLEY